MAAVQGMKRRRAAVLAGLLAAAGVAAAEPPAPGRYQAELCVSIGSAAPNCGPAAAWVPARGRLQLRVSDIVYRLALHSSQVDVVLMHGTMQIDGFVAPYDWAGEVLRFDDREKSTRYEVRLLKPA